MVNLSETPATRPDSIASRIAQLNQLAELHLNAGQLDQAQAYCQQALNLDPNCARTCKTAGNICRALGQVEVAKRWYSRAIELDPKMAEALANLGTIYAEAKQWQQAVNYYQQAIKVKPDFAGVYRNLARAWTILNQAASAANCWYRAYELEPTGITAEQYFEVGNNLLKAGQGTEAIACYKNAIKLHPNWAEAYQNLAAALQRAGALEEATICYRQAIELKAKKAQTAPTPQDTLAAATQGFFNGNGYADPQDTLLGSLSVKGQDNAANDASSISDSTFDATDYLELAKTYSDRRQWQKVISLGQKALSLKPNYADAYKLLGNAFQGLGNISSAMQCYQKAIELQPQFAEALANLGSLYGQQKQFEKAISCYQKAINLKPKVAGFYRNLAKIFAERSGKSDPQVNPQIAECWYRAYELEPSKAKPEEHFNLGNILLKQGQREKAIACYGRAIQLNPNLAAAYHNLGEILSEAGQSPEAITCYRRAIELNPKFIAGYYNLGQELAKQGDWQEALACYRSVIEADQKSVATYQKIAQILVQQKQWDAAVAVYTKVLELQPDNEAIFRQLGDIFTRQQKWQDAVTVYGRAIQLNPQNSVTYNYLGYALIQLRRWEEAAAVLQVAIKLKPDFHSCHNLGGALVQLERWEQALPAYREALQLNPSSALTYQSLGDVLMKLQRWDEAEKAYSQAVELQPDLPGICSKMGDALRERAMSDLAKALGWYHRAIEQQPDDLQNYHKALEIQPDNTQLYVQLANGLVKQGNSNGAIVFYQMALQLQPDDAGILQQLEAVSKKKGVTLPQQKIELDKAENLPILLEQAKQFLKSTSQMALDSLLNTSAQLSIPYVETPNVSIILVLYNRAELTLKCLSSILENNFKSLELIIVDNASTDQTQLLLKRIQGAKILYNSENIHFIRACNQAAQHAKGEFLLFLNNDTQILGDSIAAAVKTLESSDDIGAVGGKIILPDGTLQEAGSIIWRDGSCLGYGRGNSPLLPEYMFRRSVDYCSAAFLLTRRDLFLGMGGFDAAYLPAYYEETDYCVKLWKAGKRVVYEPNVVILHYEFASSSSTEDATQLHIRNQRIFVEKHNDWLESQYLPKLENSLLARISPKQPGKRILFMDDRVPHTFLGSGHPRGNFILSSMVALGYSVTFYPMDVSQQNEAWAEVYADIPQSVEVMMGYGYLKLTDFLQGRQGYYDVVFVSRPHNMRILKSCLEQNANLLKGSKIIYDAEALYCLREIEQMRLRGEEPSPEQIEQLIEEEVQLAAGCDRIISVSEQEKQQFVERGLSNAEVLGHAVSVSPTPNSFDKRQGILFVGAIYEMDSPNADSVKWLAMDIFPRVQDKLGQEIKLTIAGNNTVDQLIEDISKLGNPSIQMLGKVDDLTRLHNNARLFVAPTRFAAGIPFKVHEAVASGIPIVTTSLIAKQLGWQHNAEILVADDAEQFAAECIRLYQDEILWQKLRSNAIQRIKYEGSPKIFSQNLEKILTFS